MDASEEIQQAVLEALDRDGRIADSSRLRVPSLGDGVVDQQAVLGVLNRLLAHDMVAFTAVDCEFWALTEEGRSIATHGSHEAAVHAFIKSAAGSTAAVADITAALGEGVSRIGLGKAFQNKWVAQQGPTHVALLAATIVDRTREDLAAVEAFATSIMAAQRSSSPREGSCTAQAALGVPEGVLKELKKRKLIEREKITHFVVEKGPSFSLTLARLSTDLTSDMVVAGRSSSGAAAAAAASWRDATFKEYNWKAMGQPTCGGTLHPLLKVREEFRNIFLEMGFSEMPTNRFVESSFWNFDALFQPQQHPSRDAHDTFFLKEPARTLSIPADYVERTRESHERGAGSDSLGHRCAWSEDEARKNILRTHTTAISSRVLYNAAQKMLLAAAQEESGGGRGEVEGTFKPIKCFSIDRVFRNETLDATHLAEFHQIEGLVADYNLTLGNLVGMLREFFRKLGMTKLRFKPAFNPYTEPSMEVFAYHEGLQRWMEVGNSGVFRPEMLRPMGLDERVTVIAWGLSLERPTMIKYQVSNIRDLFGHKVDLAMCQSNPICRLDKA